MSLSSFFSRFRPSWLVRRRLRTTRHWRLYCFQEHPGTDLPLDALKSLLPSEYVHSIKGADELVRGGMAFIYIGHGDSEGAHSSEGFSYGWRQRFAEISDIDRLGASPLVWWCCFSENWLNKLARTDWLGFSGYIGYDTRDGQANWWSEHLYNIFAALIVASEKTGNAGTVKKQMDEMYDEALRDHFVDHKISYLNVMLAKMHADGLAIGSSFGET